MSRLRLLLVSMCLAAMALTAQPDIHARQSTRVDLSAKALVARASDYVATYQREFAFLVADENVEQHADPPAGGVARRITRGELFLTYLPRDRQWVAVRDVAEVDGMPVRDREDLPALLRQGEVNTIARRLFTQNARYNLGSVLRNFNEPTIGLAVLDRSRASRVSFSLGLIDASTPDAPLVTMTFREREEPTLVRGPRGAPVFATGDVTIEANTGRVRHTHLVVHDGIVSAELTTVYEWQSDVALWVPVVFAEHYTAKRSPRDEVITSESRYTNYRRFDVEASIK